MHLIAAFRIFLSVFASHRTMDSYPSMHFSQGEDTVERLLHLELTKKCWFTLLVYSNSQVWKESDTLFSQVVKKEKLM